MVDCSRHFERSYGKETRVKQALARKQTRKKIRRQSVRPPIAQIFAILSTFACCNPRPSLRSPFGHPSLKLLKQATFMCPQRG